MNHVERFIIDEGHTAQRLVTDYGYDLVMMTYDDLGYVEPGLVFLQLKAAESLGQVGDFSCFDLDIRDYNPWRAERLPVILVLFDASERRAFWLHVQDYFATNPRRRPKARAKTIRVLVPRRQPVSRRAVAAWRGTKKAVLARLL